MSRFMALFLAPVAVIEDWMKTDPETRKDAEAKMREAWSAWAKRHAAVITELGAGGRTRCVAADGISDVKNDIMLYAFVEVDTHEAATKIFEGHPHLQIPNASIEVMEARLIPDM